MFNKDLSIFAKWKRDTEKTLDDCAALDFRYWKVPRICKDALDLEKCEELVRKQLALELSMVFCADAASYTVLLRLETLSWSPDASRVGAGVMVVAAGVDTEPDT